MKVLATASTRRPLARNRVLLNSLGLSGSQWRGTSYVVLRGVFSLLFPNRPSSENRSDGGNSSTSSCSVRLGWVKRSCEVLAKLYFADRSVASAFTTHDLSIARAKDPSLVILALVVVANIVRYALSAVRIGCGAHFPAEIDESMREVATHSRGRDLFRYSLNIVPTRFVTYL